jgi:LCP family protein required for cell wall assembly
MPFDRITRPVRWLLAVSVTVVVVVIGLGAYEAISLASAWGSIERVSLDSNSNRRDEDPVERDLAARPGPSTTAGSRPTAPEAARGGKSAPSDGDVHVRPQSTTTAHPPHSTSPPPPSTRRSDRSADTIQEKTSGHGDIVADETIFEEASGPPSVMLLAGSDSRAGLEDLSDFGAFEGRRADVIVLVIREGDNVTLLSVPRDLYVADACRGGRHRISGALAGCGDQHGLAVLATELENLTGLEIEHAVAVDLAGFPPVVDALGGYEICAAHPLRDVKSGLDLKEGCTVADGETTLQWLRSRHTERYVDGEWQTVPNVSDLARNKRQRVFLIGMFDRLTQSSGPGEVRVALHAAAPHLTIDDALSLTDLAAWTWQFRNANVETAAIPVANETTSEGEVVLVPTVDVEGFSAGLSS